MDADAFGSQKTDMITIELSGGLGNQMFQYALGRHLSLKNKTGLSLDASKIGSYKHGKRSYALSPFDISADIITDPAGAPRPSLFRRCADLLKPYYGRSRIVERGQGFDKDILKIKPSGDNIVLSGHWQSERYFRDIEPMIRRDLTLKDPQGADFDSMAARIRSCRSVSLHVRRTDYLIEKHKNVYGMCAKEYYEQAHNEQKRCLLASLVPYYEEKRQHDKDREVDYLPANLMEKFPYHMEN